MISKIIIKLNYIFVFLGIFQMSGQQITYKGNPDISFETARKLAFNNYRKQAQDTLSTILTKYPNYDEIRAFLASTYSWDGDYKKATAEFNLILEKDTKNKSIWVAAINNQLYDNNPFVALEMTTKALDKFPNDIDVLFLKAKSQEKTENPLEALNTVESILAKNPEDKNASDYKISLNQMLRKNTIGIITAVDYYSTIFDPMQYHSLKINRRTKYGSIIARANFNRRFNKNGMQYEIDAYPRITKGLYGYLNIGFSNASIFPNLKYSAELFKMLPKSFEVSLGFRTLKYTTTTNIYTGSIGWYKGNNYFSFRPYLTPGDNGVSKSGAFTYRKYRSNADNYLGFIVGLGFSPEIDQYNNLAVVKYVNLKSQRISTSYYFTTNENKNAWGTLLNISHQEKSFSQGNFYWIYSLSLFWDLNFK
jgi:YaiO family outer membrane protein